ncbi:kielin/chordin-like protein [Uloborus diversus]|uniref:kielin/chordin-like protein n=1 Tax=Uloborus diversus TaxID=327109 RepID=UPI0024094E09|nr:kielin/chordin-like protein [Uloborus diversus]
MDKLFVTCLLITLQVSWVSSKNCKWRFYQHYAQKNCKPILDQDNCPIRFACDSMTSELRKTCVHNGEIYHDGQIIKGLNKCDSCTCYVDSHGDAAVECASTDCPDWEPQDKACYMGYLPDECCPEELCPHKNEKLRNACVRNGKSYDIGRFIPTEDPCRSCICTGDWNGKENGPGCKKVDCLILSIYAKDIRNGCLLIYGENSCCPTGTECGKIYGATPVDSPKEKDDLCYYQGKHYARGSVVFLNSDTSQRISCKCLVPPDFTCIRKQL